GDGRSRPRRRRRRAGGRGRRRGGRRRGRRGRGRGSGKASRRQAEQDRQPISHQALTRRFEEIPPAIEDFSSSRVSRLDSRLRSRPTNDGKDPTMKTRGFARASLVLLLLAPLGAAAQTFVTTLSPSAEVPPAPNNGTGVAAITVRGTSVTFSIFVTGISTPTAAHIHKAPAG